MTHRTFWSWQSWTDQRATRNYIQDALEHALKELALSEPDVAQRPEQDARGAAGAVDISEEILSKIRNASAVVADVTNCGPRRNKQLMPNPNVLFEVGFAEGALTRSQVILVANRRFGLPEAMPFDLRNRAIVFFSDEGHATRAEGVRSLTAQLKLRLEAAIAAARQRASLRVEVVEPNRSRDVSWGPDPLTLEFRIENGSSKTLQQTRVFLVDLTEDDGARKADMRLPSFLEARFERTPDQGARSELRRGVASQVIATLGPHADARVRFSLTRFRGTEWLFQGVLALAVEGEQPQTFQVTTKAHCVKRFRVDEMNNVDELNYSVAVAPHDRPVLQFTRTK